MLRTQAAISATHDAGQEFQRPGCHKNTRVAVMDRLRDWLLLKFKPEAAFLWLYGDAGAGKSSISQTFAVRCAEERHLLGSFFFWKDDSQRSTYSFLITTLVYQAVTAVPALKDIVNEAIERDPAIFQKHLKVQLITLLINPINDLVDMVGFDPSVIPNLILIDGLDECSTADAQCSILESLTDTLLLCRHRLKVLIASRPEVEIKSTFNSDPLLSCSTRLALDASFKPNDDIRRFLVDKFEAIKSTHPLKAHIPSTWPPSKVVGVLVDRSSGQFIFASTVGKYVSERRQNPVKQLDIIIGVRPPSSEINLPYTELNTLYAHVLSCIHPDKMEMALDILSFVTIVRPALPPLAYFAKYPTPTGRFGLGPDQALCVLFSVDHADLEHYLADLSSLVKIQSEGEQKLPVVTFSHASMGDFLLDPIRSQKFYRKPQTFFAKMTKICANYLAVTTVGPCSTALLLIPSSLTIVPHRS